METKLYIGIDDTDVVGSPGTGKLARKIAAVLDKKHTVVGVSRHQLLFDPRVPMTAKNSANVIHLSVQKPDVTAVANEVAKLMLAHFQPGSDPGLCVAINPPEAIIEFGQRTKVELVTATEAHQLAYDHNLLLRELGGNGEGVIGALAAVGLVASGNDGRFIQVGQVRELCGQQPVAAILAAGVDRVQTPDGQVITTGLIETNSKARPVLRKGRVVLNVEPAGNLWRVFRKEN